MRPDIVECGDVGTIASETGGRTTCPNATSVHVGARRGLAQGTNWSPQLLLQHCVSSHVSSLRNWCTRRSPCLVFGQPCASKAAGEAAMVGRCDRCAQNHFVEMTSRDGKAVYVRCG